VDVVLQHALGRRHESGAHPVDQGGVELHDVHVPDPGVRQQRRGGETQAEAADEDPQPPAAEAGQGERGQGLLARHMCGVHREHPVDDQFDHVVASGQDDLAVLVHGTSDDHTAGRLIGCRGAHRGASPTSPITSTSRARPSVR
jgi:hypothetical protein